jgi:hypothetical protein
MMGAIEAARGPFPRPPQMVGNAELAALDIPRQNELRLRVGWSAFRTRRDSELGALAPERFRALTQELVKSTLSANSPAAQDGGRHGQ